MKRNSHICSGKNFENFDIAINPFNDVRFISSNGARNAAHITNEPRKEKGKLIG